MAPVPYLKDKAAFDEALASAGGKLVAIDCTAAWCGPCQQIGPKFEAMQPEFPFVVFAKVDVDDNQEVAAQLGIKSMPTFKFFRSGALVADFSGADEGRLRALLITHGGPPTEIPAGSEVKLMALQSKPELNGRRGKVQGFDAAKGRYWVETAGEAGAETLSLKRDNLLQVGLRVSLIELAPDGSGAALPEGAEAHAFDRTGTPVALDGYDAEANAYYVDVGGGAPPVLAPAGCCQVEVGTTGVVVGLQGAPEHNGKAGRLMAHDGASGRYMVALDASKQLKLKRGNLRL